MYKGLPHGLHDRDVVVYPTLCTGDYHMDFMIEMWYSNLPLYKGLPHGLHDRDVVSYPTLCTADSHMDFMMMEMWYLMVNLS